MKAHAHRKIDAASIFLVTLCLLFLSVPCVASSAKKCGTSHAVKRLQVLAEKGDPRAQYELGLAYRDGKGVSPDLPKAFRWFLMAEKQGYERLSLPGSDGRYPMSSTSPEQREGIKKAFEKSFEAAKRADDLNEQATSLICLAAVASDQKDKEKTLHCLEQALEAYRKTGDIPGEMITLLGISETISDDKKALDYAKQSLEAARKAGSIKGRKEALERIVALYQKSKQLQEALECLKSGLEVEERNDNQDGMVQHLVKIASLEYHSMNLRSQARQYCDEAEQIAQKDGQIASLLAVCDTCRWIQDAKDNELTWHSKRIPLLEQALAVSRKVGDQWNEMVILKEIGLALCLSQQNQEAVKIWDKALEIAKRLCHDDSEYYFLNIIENQLAQNGEYKRALECNGRKLVISRENHWVGKERQTLCELARMYASLGEHEKAIRTYEKALALHDPSSDSKKGGFSDEPHRVARGIALSYLELAQYQKTIPACEAALETLEKATPKNANERTTIDSLCVNHLEIIGEAYRRLGETDKAIDYFLKAKWKNKGVAPSGLAEIYLSQGRIDEAEAIVKAIYKDFPGSAWFYLQKEDYGKARLLYEKALESAKQRGPMRMIGLFSSYTGLARVYEGKQDYKRAEEYYGKARRLVEWMRSHLPPGEWKHFDDAKVGIYGYGPVRGFRRSEPTEGMARVKRKITDPAGNTRSRDAAKAKAVEERFTEAKEPVSDASAQTREDAERLKKDADALREKPRSDEDLVEAAEKYEKALNIFRNVGDAAGEEKVLNNLGIVYSHRRQYDKASEYYEKSLAICRELADRKGEGTILLNLGIAYAYKVEYEKAVECYSKSVEIAGELGDQTTEANALNNLGNVYSDLGQYRKAVEHYEKSLEIKRKLGDLEGEGRSLNGLGIVYRHRGQYRKAVEYYEKSLAICRNLGDLKGEGSSLNNLGNVYQNWGQNAKAVEHYEKSLAIYRNLGDLKGEGSVLNNLGTVYKEWGQYPKAGEYYDRSLAIDRRLGNIKGEAGCLINLGNVFLVRGQYQKSLEYYEEARKKAEKLGDQQIYAIALHCLGLVCDGLGQKTKALDYYEKSLEIEKKLGNIQGQGKSLNSLGTMYSSWGEYKKAVKCFREALEIAKRTGNPSNQVDPLGNLADLHMHWGQYRKAGEYYEECLTICRNLGDLKGEGQSLGYLGRIYMASGDLKQAMENFQEALGIYAKVGIPNGWIKSSIAHAYLDQGDFPKAVIWVKEANRNETWGRWFLLKNKYEKAREFYQAILTYSKTSQDVKDLFTAYTGMGLSCEGMEDYRAAVPYYQKAIQLIETLREGLTQAQRENFFSVRINGFYRTTPYEGLARVLLKLNRPAESAKWAEYTKARLFAESISKRSEHSGLDVPKDVREKDSLLNGQLTALTRNLQKAYEKGNKEVIERLEPQVKEAREKLAAHVAMLRKDYPLFAATKYPQPMDLGKTAQKGSEWVVEYQVTDSELLIYLIRGKAVVKALRKQITRKDLSELVKKFRAPFEGVTEENLTDKLKTFDFGAGKQLADILLADVLSVLPKRAPLIVVPDDCLGVIPFEMLVLNEGGKISADGAVPHAVGADFFGDRNPISYSQSLTALTLARTLGTKSSAANKLLVMADPIFEKNDPRIVQLSQQGNQEILDKTTEQVIMSAKVQNKISWPRLPGTRRLAESLKKTFPDATDLCLGADANKHRFLDSDLTAYQSIVFATHGYGGNDLGGLKEPVLVLTLINQPPGEDGFLRMTEVMGKKMNADVVALTGCQTGLGRRISGEGTMGMGRAFQYAGAKSALMSLWNVAETTSVKLVESFFKYRKEGKSKLEAIRLARNDIRKAGYDHPFFWAPFILVGEVR